MEVIERLFEFSPEKSIVLTFGTFDGIHLGHQDVIKRVIDQAKEMGLSSGVLSFDPHPLYYLSPKNCPPTLTPTAKKLELLETMGVDYAVLVKLEDYISLMSPETFVKKILIENLSAKYIIVGYDCTFGRGRAGNAQALQKLGKLYNIPVEVVQPQKYKDMIVSSTQIRQAILLGELELAKYLLGRDYSICGKVVKGYGLGRKIGYPTANIDVGDQMLPPNGVYAVKVKVDKNHFYDGVLSIGMRPTFAGRQLQVEAYLFDFKGWIYGHYLEADLIQRLRGERKFPELDTLIAQIQKDIEQAKYVLCQQGYKRDC